MPWRGHPGGTVTFRPGKAEGGGGFGGYIGAVGGLELRLTHCQGQRAPEGDNGDKEANRSSPFGHAEHLLLYST